MRTDKRREEFVNAAHELFEERGIAQTGIGDISRRVGVTRSLFYHYFNDKQAIIDAVIDAQVDDFVARVKQWNTSYDSDHARESLLGIVVLIRAYLLGSSSFSNSVIREHNATLRQRFTTRSATRLAKHYARKRNVDEERIYRVSIAYPYETFYVLAVGLMSLVMQNPDISDDILVDLIARTLLAA